MKPICLKEKAIKLRKKGYSYNMISEKLGLAKSTLSGWLGDIPFAPNAQVIKRIGAGKLKSAHFKINERIQNIKEMSEIADKELGNLTKRDLWFLGIGLYLGEGSKINENIRIVNSDPEVILIAIKWFKEICGLSQDNFVPYVHLYPDTDIPVTLKFWSGITGIPLNQFGKTQIDIRTNKISMNRGKLPHGTLHLHIKSCGKKEFGRALHRRIMGWIKVSTKQIVK